MTSHICLNMLRFLRWASLSYGLPPLHFTRHSDLFRTSLALDKRARICLCAEKL